MQIYELPQIEVPKIKSKFQNFFNYLKERQVKLKFWLGVIIISIIVGSLAGAGSSFWVYYELKKNDVFLPQGSEIANEYVPQTTQEEAIIKTVDAFSPAVVSIIVSKDVPVFEQYFYDPFGDFFGGQGIQVPGYKQNGTQKQEIGGGTGFIISEDGMVLTNKHVVSDTAAEYTVYTNDGKKYPAKVLARDPVQDLAVLSIDQTSQTDKQKFPVVKIGDSDSIKIGQTVIAIGNALGEFRNTVSTGVISGLSRTITASGSGLASETLEDIIQTDAAINPGNSGGPLLNLKGEVVGINTAVASSAQSIGFAIPINKAKRDIAQMKSSGKISYPFLGVRYVLINDQVKKEKNLSVDYGALVIKGSSGEEAVSKNSAADKAGLKEGDIILEFNGEKIIQNNSLAELISKYSPGDKIILKILSAGKEKTVEVLLGERSE
jgi:serine protease Do